MKRVCEMKNVKLFEEQFNQSLRRHKNDVVGKTYQILREDALEDALDEPDNIGSNQALSDVLGDIQQQAQENQAAEQELQRMVDRQNIRINDIIMSWAEQLHKFVLFINDPENESSMKAVLDQAAEDSVFQKIKISQAKQITRIAQSVSSLEQALRSYVIGGIDEEEANAEPQQPEQPEEQPEEEVPDPQESPEVPAEQEEEEDHIKDKDFDFGDYDYDDDDDDDIDVSSRFLI